MVGYVTLSIEVELAWGVHDIETNSHLSEDGSVERTYARRLLDHCDTLGLPITFDVVGHLCHASCDGNHDGTHESGWFDADPGTDVGRDSLFYAPDLIGDIAGRPTEHELCTHTYSHVPCRTATPETVAWELERGQSQVRRVTGSAGRSFVPPRHSRPPRDVLRETDIQILRVSKDTSDRGRVARLVELLYGPHPTFEPALVDGLVETYCTSYPSLTSSSLPSGQRKQPALFRPIPTSVGQRLQRQYLARSFETAAETDGYCHLWCHLYDLANEFQWPVVRSALTNLATRRDRGELRVLTMEGLNDHVRSAPEHPKTPT
jgi:hypothetical protein